ncbi:MAG: HAD hydrolase-like protein, partial [Venatoribacter sp.]
MISPAPKLFLLDLDGTLVNSIPDLASAANAMLQALGHAQVSVNEVENWVGNGIDLLVRRALAYGDEDKALAISQDN